ncbi:hypothetical protein [Shinella pollutisoli]|uniref:Phage shock protein B n=1 Tax=Shinella pollutisoli TaxID=2250594 RepID=A0ABV7DK92_9HYPH|nr:hypothetical protein [Shinella pollutisoli]
MTLSELQWLVGIAVTFVLAIGGIAIGAFRAVGARIDKAVDQMREAVKDGDDQLHERINRLRQDVSDNYVRRVDLDSHMMRLDSAVKEIRDDQKAIIRSLAALEAKQGRQGV